MFSRRIKIVRWFFIAVFVLFVGRLFQLQILDHEYYLESANAQQIRKSVLNARRGKILVRKDRFSKDTTALATNNTLQKLFIDPLILNYPEYDPSAENPLDNSKRGNPELVAKLLAPILINAHCQEIDGCKVEFDETKWSEAQKKAISLYEDALRKEFTQIFRNRIVLETDLSLSRQKDIEDLHLGGVRIENAALAVYPLEITNAPQVAEKLAPLLGKNSDEILPYLEKRYRRYKEITDKIVPSISEEILKLKKSKKYRKLLYGVQLQDEYWRFYPERKLGAQILGFVDSKGNGQYGMESYFDEILRGKEGSISGATNTRGQGIIRGGFGIKKAEDGANIVLSIDRVLQSKVEEILEQDLEDFQADFGQVIVLQPQTGRILAMANAPTFDPNEFGEVYSRYEIPAEQEAIDRNEEPLENGEKNEFNQRIPTVRIENRFFRYFNTWGAEVFRNKIITDEYEPGSVIKAITFAAALNANEIEPETTYKDTGPIKLGKFQIRNSDGVYAGVTSMIEVLDRSLNTGIAFITRKMGVKLMYEALKNFGFGSFTDVDFGGEAKGRLEDASKWVESELITRGFGQGFTATPLQVALSFGALANGGYLMKPILVDEIQYSNGTTKQNQPERVRRVISEETSRKIRSMMYSTVRRGTGRGARIAGYSILGKTGTSQTYKNGKALTGVGTTIATFAGMAPIDDPQFVILVKYDYPKKSQWGSETATRTFRKVARFLFDYLAIPPDR